MQYFFWEHKQHKRNTLTHIKRFFFFSTHAFLSLPIECRTAPLGANEQFVLNVSFHCPFHVYKIVNILKASSMTTRIYKLGG